MNTRKHTRSPWSASALGWVPLVTIALVASGVSWLSPRSPTRMVFERAWQSPSRSLPLGAAEAGVDLLAALCHATTKALGLACVVTAVGFAVGVPLGTAAGLWGGSRAQALARACDFVQAFPMFLLALAVLSVVRAPNRFHIGLVFCLEAWAPFARMSLVQAQVLAAAPFVEAARGLGVSSVRLLTVHVLPNLLGPVVVHAGSAAAAVVLGEAALGFLGLGPRDGVSLGALLEQGVVAMLRAPHVLAFSAVAVALVSGSLQLASEVLRRWVQR